MLEPYLVLDFTDHRGEIGPMVLGDLGADVIRVEPPAGNVARRQAPFVGEQDSGDDLASLQFRAFNRNKRSIVLDPAQEADKQTLAELIARADFLLESWPNGPLADYGISRESVAELNPRIVHVRLSPYGSDGPRADCAAADLTLAAMGGPVALQGAPDRAPLRLSVPQVWRHAGVEAAVGAMAAHTKRTRDGKGQFVDLSAQAAMTWTMLNAMDAHAIQGFDFERLGGEMVNGPQTTRIVHETADGHIVAIAHSRTLVGLTEWMIEEGIVDESFREIDWVEYDFNLRNPDYEPFNSQEGRAVLGRFLVNHDKERLFRYGLENDISLAPVNTLPELLALDHMQSREYWDDNAVGEMSVRFPGLWAKPDSGGLSIRNTAPAVGEHTDEIRAELGVDVPTWKGPDATDDELPFAGLRVTDFAWVGVGPISSKFLADHGATVVRIESENRPDVLRAGVPFKDGVEGWNRSQFYGDFNTSKRSLALDMKSPEAIEIARKLITESDVMIESFAPGAIGRMGLGYEDVKKLNPGLIMISTCLMGQTGPASQLAGYGYHAGAIAGFYHVTGWEDRGPNGPWIAYTDTIAPRFVSLLLAAALDRKKRTGEGCYIDVAQIETALHFLAPELLDLQLNGCEAMRMGNRSRFYAPQGCYPCAGDDQWCAIAIETDAEWAAFLKAAELSFEFDTSTNAARLARHDELDAAITAWTQDKDRQEVFDLLQSVNVPVGMVQRSSDLLSDPQYEHRKFYKYMDHTEMGHIPYAGHQYKVSTYNNGPRGPAPCLGEHSFEVLSELLGLPDEEIAAAYASGVIT